MTLLRRGTRRRWLAPEVVQSSAMDCGPAALKCLLEGFGIAASYPRLQEACQTDIDGTSIDTIEQVATALGLDAEQVVVPVDHVMLASARALPALAVVRRESMAHFLVAWQRHGPFVQLMDPARGRRWLRRDAFQKELYVHHQRVPADAWRDWASSDEFLGPLAERLHAVGVAAAARGALMQSAAAIPGWRGLAALDASVRMVADLVRASGIDRGREARRLIAMFAEQCSAVTDPRTLIPAAYWSVLPDAAGPDDESVILRGAVLLRINESSGQPAADRRAASAVSGFPGTLARALVEAPLRPLAYVRSLGRRDGLLTPALLGAALALLAVGTLFEILLLRGLLEIQTILTLREHRLVATGLLLAFVGALLALELVVSAGVLRIGRRVETRFRAALLDKLPKLSDRYFGSRLVSDMAHRAHSLDALRGLPDLSASVARVSMQLIVTAVALSWLDPRSAWIACLAAGLGLAVPLITQPALAERELRQRVHAAALSRHYLDSLLGLVAARTHGAERALRQRHESLLVEWGRASLHLLRGSVVIEGFQTMVGTTLAAFLVLDFVARGTRPGGTLLLVYWALNLPVLGRELAGIVRQFPAYRNIVSRLLEPLTAPDTDDGDVPAAAERAAGGVAIAFDDVAVHVSTRPVLAGVNLTIRAGEHVAVVGRSGAGKSSLVGLLLGWRVPSRGAVMVDDRPLDATALVELRRATAWVDPAVQLWNRSLFDNLRYGHSPAMIPDIGSILETAQLAEVLEKLPRGLQSPLGEGGRLTSGGEGQRVRFGRALVHDGVRLAILDEPFRGLDRQQRHEMLARSRDIWRDATLLCVTHDIEETLAFERVLVLDAGRVVEDGNPAVLAAAPDSVYAALLAAEQAVRLDLWSSSRWRRWRLDDGVVTEGVREAEDEWTVRQASPGR